MSPRDNHLQYLAYFHKLIEDCTPAVADDPEWHTQQHVDNGWQDPTTLPPTTKGRQYALRMQAEGRRYCQRCGHWRPTEYFGVDRSRTSGYQGYCKQCRNEQAKQSYRNKTKG